MRQLYGACDLFVYPSFYEGFGLTILEAMASARAVACSNTSGMPEVADSAALLSGALEAPPGPPIDTNLHFFPYWTSS